MFITMGVAAHSAPLYSAYTASAGYSINPELVKPNAAGVFPPVQQSVGLPDQSNFGASINGLLNAVYAYSGTQLFIDFMAEMTNPRDFLKSMWGSQLFIYVCYMLYGLFMYGYQGQYVQNPSYLGISPYAWSTTGNVLAMVTALIAAALYGNIGLKGMLPSEGVGSHAYIHQSFTTASASRSSKRHHFTPEKANGSGPAWSQSIGLSHTWSVAPFQPFLVLSHLSLQYAPCNSPTRSRHFYTWAT
jgi:hypothetical protein